MKTKNMRIYLALITTILLTACGSGGSGADGGMPIDPSNGGGGTGGGGSSTGGDGNAAYYGFSTDSLTKITNQTNPLLSGTNQMTIATEITFNIRNLNTRALDVMIFQPTCIVGLLKETYSVVLLSGSNTSAAAAAITVSANGLTFQERGVLSGVNMYDYGSLASASGTCSGGEMNLGSSGTLYSNGKIMIWKTGLGDLYIGGRSSSIENVMANFQLKQYDKYEQINNNSVNPSSALSIWTSGDVGQVVTDLSASSSHSAFASSSGNTLTKGFASNTPNARYAANTNGYSISSTQHTRAWTNLSSDVPFFGFGISSLGSSGKAISLTVTRKTFPSNVMSNNSVTIEDIKGAGSVLIHVQK